jgi:hypothetical protein
MLSQPNPDAAAATYPAELATLSGASTGYGVLPDTDTPADNAGYVSLTEGDSATFWVYSENNATHELELARAGGGTATVTVDGHEVLASTPDADDVGVSLNRGINKVVVTGASGTTHLDTLKVTEAERADDVTVVQAESGTVNGTATVKDLPNAVDGKAVAGIGGDPGNSNTLTLTVDAASAGPHALRLRYSNPDQSAASHYNPDTISRHGDLAVNGADPVRFWVPSSFHINNFWETTVVVDLEAGENTLTFSSEELPTPEGTYLSQDRPDWQLNSKYAPVLDRVAVTPFSTSSTVEPDSVFTGSASLQCRGKRAFLAVSVRNTGDVPGTASVTTSYGEKTFAHVAPGASVSHEFNTRTATAPADSVHVTATVGEDSSELALPYGELACGKTSPR